jgi:hypothetical protein
MDWFSVLGEEGQEIFDTQIQGVESGLWQSGLDNYTNWVEDWFNILSELEDEQVDKIQTSWQNVYDYDAIKPMECSECVKEVSIFFVLFWWIVISSLIYLIILMIYYVVFKVKRIQNPLKYAFKRSRLWWIMLLIFPVIVVVVLMTY